jgi:hypothetical protein
VRTIPQRFPQGKAASATGEGARLGFERDGFVGVPVAEAMSTPTGIRAQVPGEEAGGAELAPLTHVNELVSDEPVIVLVPAPHQDQPAECHPSDPRRQDRDRRETGTVEIPHRDVRELPALVSVEPARHRPLIS